MLVPRNCVVWWKRFQEMAPGGGNEMPPGPGRGKGGADSGGCHCRCWPPWWAKLVIDEWSVDASTQTNFSD